LTERDREPLRHEPRDEVVAPSGAKGTMILTDLVGYGSVRIGAAAATLAAAASATQDSLT